MASGCDDAVGASIPSDVVHYNILPRLPYKSLSRFKCICRKWHHLISHDILFAREQSRHRSPISSGYVYRHKQTINFIPIDIPGELNVPIAGSSFFSLPIGVECAFISASVNGLLLLVLKRTSDGQNDSTCSINHPGAIESFYYVWNFVTKKGYAAIPRNVHPIRFVGLAFDPSITPARYEVVSLLQRPKGLHLELSFDVYSSRTRKWTVSDRKIRIPGGECRLWDVFCGGRIIYWNCNRYALWFDVVKDVAGSTLLPAAEDLESQHVLGVTNDGILTSSRFLKNDTITITIWMMSKDGDWVKKFYIENVPMVSSEFNRLIPLPFTGGDRIYMEMFSDSLWKKILACYDINTQELTMISEMKGGWPPSKWLYIDHNRIARLGSPGVTED